LTLFVKNWYQSGTGIRLNSDFELVCAWYQYWCSYQYIPDQHWFEPCFLYIGKPFRMYQLTTKCPNH
jgi:hypothetical protein